MSPFLRDELQKQNQRYLDNRVIRKADSEWNSPVIMFPKGINKSHGHLKDKKAIVKYRMVVDLRQVNLQIVYDTRIIPNIDDILDQVCQSYDNPKTKPMIFSVLDCSDAFYQLPLHTDSRQVTAFQAG